jgi:branched-chain amino acid transport system ATP-binding protein
MSTPAISCRGLYAGYGDIAVVRNINLDVQEDEVVLLLGPNGAGKTTTLLTIAGLLPKLGGEVEVVGAPVNSKRPYTMPSRGLSFVPDNRALVTGMSVRDNLRVAVTKDSLSVDDVLSVFPDLTRRLKIRAGALSGGEQQQLAMGRALMSRPKVLVIDEMSMGLAPIIVQRLMETIVKTAAETHTGVLMVEQHVSLGLQHADRAYVLVHGDVTLEASCAQLRADPELLTKAYFGGPGEAPEHIEALAVPEVG